MMRLFKPLLALIVFCGIAMGDGKGLAGSGTMPDAHDGIKQQWIGAAAEVAAPLLRRSFVYERTLAEAVLFICGLGYHEPWINGARVGDHVLDPAQTDYEDRVLYVRHDVTEMLREGTNVLGVVLGNGFYHQNRVWGRHGMSYGQPRLMAELHLRFEDGSREVVRADEQWRWAPGPITANNVYAGEVYDARLEIPGWNLPDFDDSDWNAAQPLPPPGGAFVEQVMPPIRRIEELRPVSITEPRPNTYVVDFGQNFAGWARIKVQAPAGTEIKLRYAETIFPDGMIDPASTGVFATRVEQIDRYISKGEGLEIWEPRFTYHGFRYVEVTGWPGELSAEQILGIVVHNDLPEAGRFASSDERLNTLHNMALWTLRSNLHGIPEDCPAREKCGWLGDANLMAEYALWNYDARSFFEKFLGDIETTRRRSGGIPADVAPGKRGTGRPGNPDWAATFIMLPWYLYLHSGDADVVQRHWQGMQQLMTHYSRSAPEWILGGGWGDFFDPGTDAIVQHTPQALTTTLWFFRCAEVMSKMATVLGDTEAANLYRAWQAHIADALRARFFDATSGSFGSQAANVLALAFDVLPEENDRILAALVEDIRARDHHMNVGIMGVRYIFEELARRGHGGLALALLHQDSYPSFGHLIQRGATTLWESWGEAEHDRKHGARSLNHPFMGGFDNYFFNTLAGIRPDPKQPGFKHFFLEPHPIARIEWIRCHHDTAYGRIESNWRFEDNEFIWNISVPPGTEATAIVPFGGGTQTLSAGDHEIRRSPPPNTAPVADSQSRLLHEGTAKNITLTGSAAYGDPLTFSIVSGPTNGSLSGTVPHVAYTPHAGYVGSDAFTFKVNDGLDDSADATVSITVMQRVPSSVEVEGGTVSEYTDTNGVSWRVHTFIEVGDTPVIVSDNVAVDYLVVAGGGGGGANRGGGGGAGGMLTGATTLSAGTHVVTVGDGGAGSVNDARGMGSDGQSSSIGTLLVAIGGGGGSGNSGVAGRPGGSGGGGDHVSSTAGGSGAAGQGHAGGFGGGGTESGHGGGGGGAGGVGFNSDNLSTGGPGRPSSITGTEKHYAGGGGGGRRKTTGGEGGIGGGGNGGTETDGGAAIDAPTAGAPNTGGGGGGGTDSNMAGAKGGSGIVAIRYMVLPKSTIPVVED